MKYIDIDGRELYISNERLMTQHNVIYSYVEKVTPILHRLDGPAYIEYKNDKIYREIYMQHGKRHREDGPALINYEYDTIDYFWHDKLINDLVEKYPEILTDKALRKILL